MGRCHLILSSKKVLKDHFNPGHFLCLQFYRSFPRPPEVTDEHVDLLVQKYRDPDRSGLLNYLNLHNDLEALGQQMLQEEAISLNQVTNISDFLPPEVGSLSQYTLYTLSQL